MNTFEYKGRKVEVKPCHGGSWFKLYIDGIRWPGTWGNSTTLEILAKRLIDKEVAK